MSAVSRALTRSMVARRRFSSLGSSQRRSALSRTSCLCTFVNCSRLFSRNEIFCFWASEPPSSSAPSSELVDFFILAYIKHMAFMSVIVVTILINQCCRYNTVWSTHLEILHEELAQIVQGLKFLGDSVFQAFEICTSLLTPLHALTVKVPSITYSDRLIANCMIAFIGCVIFPNRGSWM